MALAELASKLILVLLDTEFFPPKIRTFFVIFNDEGP